VTVSLGQCRLLLFIYCVVPSSNGLFYTRVTNRNQTERLQVQFVFVLFTNDQIAAKNSDASQLLVMHLIEAGDFWIL